MGGPDHLRRRSRSELLEPVAIRSNRNRLQIPLISRASSRKTGFHFFAARSSASVSPKQPVHKPFRLAGLPAPQALAIEPEAAPFRILGAEIVARRRSGAPPPGRGDALRPLDCRDIVQDSPPAETQRRPIGHFGQGLDRLRASEQAYRPRRRARRNRLGLLATRSRVSSGEDQGGGSRRPAQHGCGAFDNLLGPRDPRP